MTENTGGDTDRITVATRFNGPPDSANGGYVSGRIARSVDAAAVRVRLRTPPPLATPMEVRRTPDGGVHLMSGERLAAEATAAPVPPRHTAPVPLDEAERASAGYRGRRDHPFPTCFVCGTARAAGDGLRIFAGPLGGDPAATTVACVWRPGPDTLDTPMVWAALDCPGAWSVDLTTGPPMLLGQMTAAVFAPPREGGAHAVVGRLLDVQGRKVHTATALYDGDGTELARAEAVWIRLRES